MPKLTGGELSSYKVPLDGAALDFSADMTSTGLQDTDDDLNTI